MAGVTCSAGQLYAQVNSSTLQLSLTPPIYRFDKSAQATTSLTPGADRERQVLKMIAGGLSNKMIGNKLGITEGTVKVHVKNLLHKLGLRSRVEAAVWSMEHLH